MLKKIKNRWLRALRGKSINGLYHQAKNEMHDEYQESFCCLGVLRNETTGFDRELEDEYFNCEYTKQLNKEERREHGLTKRQCTTLMKKNDDGQSFTEIADWIEEKIPVKEE